MVTWQSTYYCSSSIVRNVYKFLEKKNKPVLGTILNFGIEYGKKLCLVTLFVNPFEFVHSMLWLLNFIPAENVLSTKDSHASFWIQNLK